MSGAGHCKAEEIGRALRGGPNRGRRRLLDRSEARDRPRRLLRRPDRAYRDRAVRDWAYEQVGSAARGVRSGRTGRRGTVVAGLPPRRTEPSGGEIRRCRAVPCSLRPFGGRRPVRARSPAYGPVPSGLPPPDVPPPVPGAPPRTPGTGRPRRHIPRPYRPVRNRRTFMRVKCQDRGTRPVGG